MTGTRDGVRKRRGLSALEAFGAIWSNDDILIRPSNDFNAYIFNSIHL